ncbi:hypothetical protein EXIGLDRAFT_717565 [Exidia glandulosa HHB12029]|uniref:Cupin type-2 domain-containing protein n=1 Tax=Exidia glandulosa HHB12029 TaxID=1314781 RepID=A0A165IAU9_EXIGL|nr:hypothetical protein EXIGLDRAFT_717565 [Exidia glandulosa HHB12029]
MSSSAPPPPVRRIVTGHSEGKNGVPRAVVQQDSVIVPKAVLPSGAGSLFGTLWTLDSPTPDLSDKRDLASENYQPERVAPVDGSRFGFVDFPPNQISPLHRTVTLDYAVITQGSLVLHLNDGTTTRAETGDVIIQRGTMHAFENPSSTEWARMFYTAADAKPYVVKVRRALLDLSRSTPRQIQLEQQFLPPPKPSGSQTSDGKSA